MTTLTMSSITRFRVGGVASCRPMPSQLSSIALQSSAQRCPRARRRGAPRGRRSVSPGFVARVARRPSPDVAARAPHLRCRTGVAEVAEGVVGEAVAVAVEPVAAPARRARCRSGPLGSNSTSVRVVAEPCRVRPTRVSHIGVGRPRTACRARSRDRDRSAGLGELRPASSITPSQSSSMPLQSSGCDREDRGRRIRSRAPSSRSSEALEAARSNTHSPLLAGALAVDRRSRRCRTRPQWSGFGVWKSKPSSIVAVAVVVDARCRAPSRRSDRDARAVPPVRHVADRTPVVAHAGVAGPEVALRRAPSSLAVRRCSRRSTVARARQKNEGEDGGERERASAPCGSGAARGRGARGRTSSAAPAERRIAVRAGLDSAAEARRSPITRSLGLLVRRRAVWSGTPERHPEAARIDLAAACPAGHSVTSAGVVDAADVRRADLTRRAVAGLDGRRMSWRQTPVDADVAGVCSIDVVAGVVLALAPESSAAALALGAVRGRVARRSWQLPVDARLARIAGERRRTGWRCTRGPLQSSARPGSRSRRQSTGSRRRITGLVGLAGHVRRTGSDALRRRCRRSPGSARSRRALGMTVGAVDAFGLSSQSKPTGQGNSMQRVARPATGALEADQGRRGRAPSSSISPSQSSSRPLQISIALAARRRRRLDLGPRCSGWLPGIAEAFRLPRRPSRRQARIGPRRRAPLQSSSIAVADLGARSGVHIAGADQVLVDRPRRSRRRCELQTSSVGRVAGHRDVGTRRPTARRPCTSVEPVPRQTPMPAVVALLVEDEALVDQRRRSRRRSRCTDLGEDRAGDDRR